jgi:hypothetical protein
MISRSLLFSGPPGSECHVYRTLGISPQNVTGWEADGRFLQDKENGAFIASVGGDFELAIEVFLFDVDERSFLDRLGICTAVGVRLAVPDEDTDMPDAFLLWEDGACRPAAIDQIDDDFHLRCDPTGCVEPTMADTGKNGLAG